MEWPVILPCAGKNDCFSPHNTEPRHIGTTACCDALKIIESIEGALVTYMYKYVHDAFK